MLPENFLKFIETTPARKKKAEEFKRDCLIRDIVTYKNNGQIFPFEEIKIKKAKLSKDEIDHINSQIDLTKNYI